jgi:predicted nucleotidyltransferase
MFARALPVDIIPFGPIAIPDAKITWPNSPDFTMNMLGFEEAHAFSLNVRLSDDPILEVRVSAPQSLAIMKLISWDERAGGDRDASDLFLIMSNYLDLGNTDRLTNDAFDLLEEPDFDYERAGARLLGRDMAASCNAETAGHLLKILVRETGEKDRYRLVEDMGGRGIFGDGGKFEKILDLLDNLRIGFVEKMGEKG